MVKCLMKGQNISFEHKISETEAPEGEKRDSGVLCRDSGREIRQIRNLVPGVPDKKAPPPLFAQDPNKGRGVGGYGGLSYLEYP